MNLAWGQFQIGSPGIPTLVGSTVLNDIGLNMISELPILDRRGWSPKNVGYRSTFLLVSNNEWWAAIMKN